MAPEQSVYLNHAGTSWPKPQPVQQAIRRVWESDPGDWAGQFESDHRRVADFFHIPDTRQLLFTPACTTALSIAVFDHFWNSGDRVLTSGYEHHALHRPLVKLVDQGVDVEVIPSLPHEPILLEAFEHSLKQGKVKLVAITAASNVTGNLMPYETIIRLSHEYGARVLIDAAQIAGWWDLDLPQLGADLVAFAGHKGTQSPWGIGGLYVAPDIEMNSPAAVCEITYDKHSGKPKPTPIGPGWCDGGSVDRPALAGLAAGTEWLRAPEQADRLAQARGLAARVFEALQDMPKITIFGSNAPEERMPTVAFNFRHIDSILVAKRLSEQGIYVSGGMQCAPLAHKTLETAPAGVVRISFGPKSTAEDASTAIEAIRQLNEKSRPQ